MLNKSATDLKLKDDGTGQVIVQCKEEITNCPENVLCIMKKGDKNRRIGETNMNERSSRSHTIFRIVSLHQIMYILAETLILSECRFAVSMYFCLDD